MTEAMREQNLRPALPPKVEIVSADSMQVYRDFRVLTARPIMRSALTLRVQLHHRVKYLRSVPATVFFPRPDVGSAVVRLEPRDPVELPEHDDELLLKLIRIGFSQRRKQLRKLLREYARDWNTLASCLTIDPNARAEELSLLQWIALANCIAPPPCLGMRSTPNEQFPVVDKNDRIRGYASWK